MIEAAPDLWERKRRFVANMRESMRLCRLYDAACERGEYPEPPDLAPMSPDLAGLPCAAKTRAGTPCKRLDIWGNGRCPLHGGKSTGPTTAKGRKRALRNLRLGRLKRREPHGRATNGNISGR